jgi:hypothetical protein
MEYCHNGNHLDFSFSFEPADPKGSRQGARPRLRGINSPLPGIYKFCVLAGFRTFDVASSGAFFALRPAPAIQMLALLLSQIKMP